MYSQTGELLRLAAAQFYFQILSGQRFQLENLGPPFPKQVRAHQIKDRPVVVRVERRQVKRHRKLKFFDQRICPAVKIRSRSEEHTSELQSHLNLVCRLLLEKKKKR